jgi:hypothetical protein
MNFTLLQVAVVALLPMIATARINDSAFAQETNPKEALSSIVSESSQGVITASFVSGIHEEGRMLDVSQECLDDTMEILGDMTVDPPEIDLDEDCEANNKVDQVTCDLEKYNNLFKASCEQEGGRFVSLDYKIKCSGDDVALKVKNFPDCIAPSCNVDEILEQAEDALEDTNPGCKIDISGVTSSLGSSFVSFGLMISMTVISFLA